MNEALTAVDLFAGGGGLSVGLKRAGFLVTAAVELDADAVATYKANHPEVMAFRQDIRLITGEDLLSTTPEGHIDLLAGCPPCQGFSSLTKKYKDRSDLRNTLVREMGRLVAETLPRAVMMENVPGLVDADVPFYTEFLTLLDELGYKVSQDVLQVADYGVPQNRRRLVLLAGRGFEIQIPKATHSRHGDSGLQPWRTLRDAIGDMQPPLKLSEAKRKGGPSAVNWHVVRDIRPKTLARLRATKAGGVRSDLPEELRPNCHKGRDEGFINVYGRMTWEQLPVTITSGCLTFSKGRFGHPVEDRTISLREAARIQTFPDSYVINTESIDKAATIVGNALPCAFAEAVSIECAAAIRTSSVDIEVAA